ncbi:DUF4199 domain-containing protein [Pontibacter sp. SGAir0037]|uniref:DUF4199 domain-containing protein n=1 Tax=Pontibacter sp. SGAir0037 TaxID=2571030 RepID=UPI0010CD3B23|nr:DUF4199 domain-containing protein [Pontibacter sp. SGAir0037]QCR23213.1 DUF4199 domain-containing protein [Pontibacter sp. SGAir0037]
MFDQGIARVGVRYGVLSGVACFALVIVMHLVGFNPLAESGRITYLPIPVFLFLGIKYYKQFIDAELGFLRGLRVGVSVSFYTALTAAMLLFLFLYFAGDTIISDYIAESKRIMETQREMQVEALGEKLYEQTYAALDSVSASLLATSDFVTRFLAGFFIAIVAAVFFRK